MTVATAQSVDKRRRMSAAIKISIAIHALALLLLFWTWRYWPLTLTIIVINHLVLLVAGFVPRSPWIGANVRRLPPAAAAAGQLAITIDDGPDPLITPQVLDLLDQLECKVTFFCVGEQVAAHADLAREIVRRGHSIENHTQRHPLWFSGMGPAGIRREVLQAQDTIAAAAGTAPRFFRAPAGFRNPLLDGILNAAGLRLVSWTRRGFDTVSTDPKVVLARLTRNLRGGDILLLHDGHAARAVDGSPVILRVLPELVAAARRAGLDCVTLRAALQPASAAKTT